jgi:hypothetical protein
MDIDHIDGNPSNNCWSNLRLATRAENMQNGSYAVGKSGMRGVRWFAHSKSWHVRIRVNGKDISLAYHRNLEDAKAVRIAAEIKYYGEFRRKG